ncbi:MFS transporter [Klebsiella variicola subsp. variicola]|nr:MFS transporter [Klebsiella variicola subsp. variicola]
MPPGRAATPLRIRRVQKITLTLLFIAGIVNFLDRSSLSVAGKAIRADLGLSATEFGVLLSAFSLSYGFAQLPSGYIAGSRWTAHCARRRTDFLVRNAGPDRDSQFVLAFILLRIGLGIGEAPFMPAGVKSINDWYAQRARYGGGDI